MKDLFGNEVAEVPDSYPMGYYQRQKAKLRYRVATDKAVRCGTCDNLRKFEYHNKTYRKCMLIGVSHSTATDIAVRNVCDRWRKI